MVVFPILTKPNQSKPANQSRFKGRLEVAEVRKSLNKPYFKPRKSRKFLKK